MTRTVTVMECDLDDYIAYLMRERLIVLRLQRAAKPGHIRVTFRATR